MPKYLRDVESHREVLYAENAKKIHSLLVHLLLFKKIEHVQSHFPFQFNVGLTSYAIKTCEKKNAFAASQGDNGVSFPVAISTSIPPTSSGDKTDSIPVGRGPELQQELCGTRSKRRFYRLKAPFVL